MLITESFFADPSKKRDVGDNQKKYADTDQIPPSFLLLRNVESTAKENRKIIQNNSGSDQHRRQHAIKNNFDGKRSAMYR